MSSRSLLLSTMIAAGVGVGALPATAQILDDPLHGFCDAATCTDNGTLTTGALFNGTHWGFNISGNTGPATFDILFAVPNNASPPASIAVTGTINGVTVGSVIANALGGQWTGGDVAAVPSVAALLPGGTQPPNPSFGAYLAATNAVDHPASTGYDLFMASIADVTLQANPASGTSVMDLSATLPAGSFILGFFNNFPPGNGDWAATASSGALFDGLPPTTVKTPEPASLGLLGLGVLGLGMVASRRRSA